jgi:dTDP-4-amino-4,6-dideoxygalactose transaminase
MSQNGSIPFVDLVTPHRELQEELVQSFRAALDTAGFIGGPVVEGLESDFAAYCDARHCIAVSSGTDALRFALMAAGIKAGDIVLTVPLTFIATTEAISQAGAQIDFIDVDPRTYTMDPEQLRLYLETRCAVDPASGLLIHRASGKPVRAIVPVHLYGQTADMDPILEVAELYGLVVIEDACQAHGAEYFSKKENRWRKAGSMGRAAGFSFYPGKNLGACGEGGAVTTNDPALARMVSMLRDHGQSKKYYHDLEGYNGRLDSIQAGLLRIKLRQLTKWNEQRRECARRYNELLSSLVDVIVTPYQPSYSNPVYHLYVIRAGNRDGLQQHLTKAGIGSGIHYPIPVHLQNAYAGRWSRGEFPVCEEAADQILSLPMYPGLNASQQVRVAEAVAEFIRSSPSAELPGRSVGVRSRALA